MTVIERSALLAHPVEQVFDLVADIERYPEFLKGCVGADILKREAMQVTATLRLSRAGISHGFTTHNTMQRPHRIDLALVDGPFTHFAGHWSFWHWETRPAKPPYNCTLNSPAALQALLPANYSTRWP